MVEFLRASEQRWDTIYSVWGAAWFSNPNVLLPLVRGRLEPGGPPAPGRNCALPTQTATV